MFLKRDRMEQRYFLMLEKINLVVFILITSMITLFYTEYVIQLAQSAF